MKYYLAIDIGASSGRHILGHIEDGKIVLEEIHRFSNEAKEENGHLVWDTEHLFQEILNGLVKCRTVGKIPSFIGVDTWAVDYVLLDKNGEKLGPVYAYRDKRTAGMDAETERIISFKELYEHTGIQKQIFNTVYQLQASDLTRAEGMLMIPDYLHYLLTGKQCFEYTNATTTGLVNAYTKTWDTEIIQRLGYPVKLFPQLSLPGTVIGPLKEDIQNAVGFNCTVVLPATHDTGSAFLAVPAVDDNAVYISSGTWSLLGIENNEPVITEESRKANFTNEGGYDYRYRFLKNIMGLWVIQNVRKECGAEYSFAQLIDEAENSGYDYCIDINDPLFLAPESMCEALRTQCKKEGKPVPKNRAELLSCAYYSLARCYADEIRKLAGIAGKKFTSVNVVGGGANAAFLNRLTAEMTGLPVYAGPTEGTALGNLMVQMIADGVFKNPEEARSAVRNSFNIEKFEGRSES